jgi:hypothetical protein
MTSRETVEALEDEIRGRREERPAERGLGKSLEYDYYFITPLMEFVYFKKTNNHTNYTLAFSHNHQLTSSNLSLSLALSLSLSLLYKSLFSLSLSDDQFIRCLRNRKRLRGPEVPEAFQSQIAHRNGVVDSSLRRATGAASEGVRVQDETHSVLGTHHAHRPTKRQWPLPSPRHL